ncbi:MAG: AAA family ATPase, partial [Rickettsiaceae bacterium]|nr:AAA family ATPase [Rickettsiaceae bacterium]
MSDAQNTTFFAKAKNILWPITWHENKKFLPMAAMMFFMLFNYSMLRSVKDGFVVTDIGAEAISFLKTYVVFPSAIIAMIIYAKLCNAMSQQKVFYTVSGFFIVYLAIFTFFIYPDPSLSHPNPEVIARLSHEYPNFKWFIKIVGNWGSASFYTVSELWGSLMVSLLFWQFANQITKTDEAKRFYSMFGLLANFSLPLTSLVLATFLGENAGEYFGHLKFTPVLLIAIGNVVAIMVLYWWINANVLTDPTLYDPSAIGGGKKKKEKLSLGESFKMIFSSKYLGFIAILVIAYGISLNLVEGVWKAKMKELYP